MMVKRLKELVITSAAHRRIAGMAAGVTFPRMSEATPSRSYGKVFNEVAVEYDRNRPTYPEALVERACAVAGIGDGDRVLEIGCGTGQLTRSLLARRLRVTALEPGDQLIGVAKGEAERCRRRGVRARAARGRAVARGQLRRGVLGVGYPLG
jgi:2-polyprenyl-3-methyl-5-hydroxy-6-metoxy-1,4-benzoquinol methylase